MHFSFEGTFEGTFGSYLYQQPFLLSSNLTTDGKKLGLFICTLSWVPSMYLFAGLVFCFCLHQYICFMHKQDVAVIKYINISFHWEITKYWSILCEQVKMESKKGMANFQLELDKLKPIWFSSKQPQERRICEQKEWRCHFLLMRKLWSNLGSFKKHTFFHSPFCSKCTFREIPANMKSTTPQWRT